MINMKKATIIIFSLLITSCVAPYSTSYYPSSTPDVVIIHQQPRIYMPVDRYKHNRKYTKPKRHIKVKINKPRKRK